MINRVGGSKVNGYSGVLFKMNGTEKNLQRRRSHSLAVSVQSMKNIVFTAGIFFVCLAWQFCAAQYKDDEVFFSYERFYDKAVVMQKPPRDGKLQSDVSRFLNEFSAGIYAISRGDMEQAKAHLKTARVVWPEYFGTDFLLARVNEDTGNLQLAARYYKSYLNKLRSFWLRENRISEELIKSITSYSVESYAAATEMVEKRLKDYGIELSGVRPIYTIPPLVKGLVLFFIAIAGYFLLAYVVLPYVRKLRRIANAPEGYWVCPKCGTENTVLQNECGTCRMPQTGEKKDDR